MCWEDTPEVNHDVFYLASHTDGSGAWSMHTCSSLDLTHDPCYVWLFGAFACCKVALGCLPEIRCKLTAFKESSTLLRIISTHWELPKSLKQHLITLIVQFPRIFLKCSIIFFANNTSGNRTRAPGSRSYSDLLDTLADSVCIHLLVLKRRSKR